MKDTTCCTFHHHGGPTSFSCDNYGRGEDADISATAENYDEEPVVHASDLCDWDAYSGAAAEAASAAVDAIEVPVEV